jgi:hypothetical protein
LSVSNFSRYVSKAGIDGSLDPRVDTKSVSPLATGVPIAPFDPSAIHQRGSPVSRAYASSRVDPRTMISVSVFAAAAGRNTIGVAHPSMASGRSRRHRRRPVLRSSAIRNDPLRWSQSSTTRSSSMTGDPAIP